MRVMGDGLRRIAETESDIWYRELIEPLLAQGKGPDDFPETTHDLAGHGDQLLLAILHGRQAHAWLDNVVRGFSGQLAMAGIHEPPPRVPTMGFIDVTGYTRMTAERGDAAAAHLAEQFVRIVERTSTQFGGKPVKWLGDGVMVHFEEAKGAVAGVLEMLPALAVAGLPSAHVGLHSGEVHFNQGDYFGQTVNVCARIADFARPNEVLVSAETVAAAGDIDGIRFELIGPVELKGVDGPVELHVARREQ
jgi:class 3 adenylate cyclase